MQALKKEHQKIKKVNILFCDGLILFFPWPMAGQATPQATPQATAQASPLLLLAAVCAVALRLYVLARLLLSDIKKAVF